MNLKKKIDLFQIVVNISSIIALTLQCVSVPEPWNEFIPYIAYIVIMLSVLSAVVNFIVRRKSIYKRTRLIEMTKKRMINSTGKIVMLGGDLSWTEDYIDVIEHVTSNSQTVEIIFPLDKIANAKESVINKFEEDIDKLRKAGADIYCIDNEHHLRCTLIDVNPECENESLCIISSKRIYKDVCEPRKNKYQINVLENAQIDDHILCNSFYRNYCLIKLNSNKY